MGGGIQVTAKIRFKRQYKPVGFGDPPDPRTVDGKRLSATDHLSLAKISARLKPNTCLEAGN
jgi:hypothetical protein